jgi:hypothetical protein
VELALQLSLVGRSYGLAAHPEEMSEIAYYGRSLFLLGICSLSRDSLPD